MLGGNEDFRAVLDGKEWALAENLQIQAPTPLNATKEEIISVFLSVGSAFNLLGWPRPQRSTV